MELIPGTLQELNKKAYRQGYSPGRYVTVVCRVGRKFLTVSPCGVWYEHEKKDFNVEEVLP